MVDMREFLQGLVANLRSEVGALHPVALHVNAEALPLAVGRAVPVGLIVNELVTNALKYAFPDRQAGSVWVGLRREGGTMVLAVEDEGIGCDPTAAPQGIGIGLRLVKTLAAQLGGRAVPGASRGEGRTPGTEWRVHFPLRSP